MASAKRNIVTFEPSVTGGIISKETINRKRKGQIAPVRKLIEEALIFRYGHKYPKICPPELLAKVMAGEEI